MSFCTVIKCMDGRVQLPVIQYLKKRFDVEYVDSITEPGPNLVLSEQKNEAVIQSILHKLKISVEIHNSVGIAVAGHYDCAGNPASRDLQIEHIHKSMDFLHQHYENMEVIGLWVDENWEVHEVNKT